MESNLASPPSATDGSLLRRLADGQGTAAEALYRRYADRLRALAQAKLPGHLTPRADPEDVIQSVFRVFFESARKGLYQVPDGKTLWNLLGVVTVNKVRALHSYHGAARRDARLTVAWTPEADDPVQVENDLLEIAVRDVLDQLPNPERAAVEWRLEGYEVAEIANRIGRSKRSVERLLQKARERLTVLMGPLPV
jgi:RNA polymerase sigma-70 factor, ECF subfamily